jgi:hypothetical protein
VNDRFDNTPVACSPRTVEWRESRSNASCAIQVCSQALAEQAARKAIALNSRCAVWRWSRSHVRVEEDKRLYSVDGILKLVGASSEDAGTVLVLLRGGAGGHPRVELLTVSTGSVTPVPYDPASSQDLQMGKT